MKKQTKDSKAIHELRQELFEKDMALISAEHGEAMQRIDKSFWRASTILFFIAWIFVMGVTLYVNPDIGISQQTADEVCIALTGNESAVASDTQNKDFHPSTYKLICKIPSYGSTHNIIIKSEGGGE